MDGHYLVTRQGAKSPLIKRAWGPLRHRTYPWTLIAGELQIAMVRRQTRCRIQDSTGTLARLHSPIHL